MSSKTESKKVDGRYPEYLPKSYRIFLKARKIYRQYSMRLAENKARKFPPTSVEPDGPASWTPESAVLASNPIQVFSKGAWWLDEDLARPEFSEIARQVDAVKDLMTQKKLRFTNTAATFMPRMFYPRSERSKLWENAITVLGSELKDGERVMDIGGASTPFSFYLASRGCSTAILDNDWANCGTLYNAGYVAKKMGWKIDAHDADVAKPFPFESNSFDRIFSICTIEHLPSPVRRAMMKEVGRVLKPGGVAAITMCYDMNHPVLTVDKGMRFGYWEKFKKDLIDPSALALHGPIDRTDYQGRDFLGAVFLKK